VNRCRASGRFGITGNAPGAVSAADWVKPRAGSYRGLPGARAWTPWRAAINDAGCVVAHRAAPLEELCATHVAAPRDPK
jgi:hypothetical protein